MKRGVLLAVLCLAVLLPVTPGGAASAAVSSASESASRRLGSLSIPRLNLSSPIFSGTSDAVYRRGVGHFPGSAMPGERGNVVLGGHRTTAPRPFYDIQHLVKGDRISITRGGRTFQYVVSRTFVVKPTAVWILNQTAERTLTIFTCHPRGSTRQRYVVVAKLRS